MVLSHVSGGAFFEVYGREEVQEESTLFKASSLLLRYSSLTILPFSKVPS